MKLQENSQNLRKIAITAVKLNQYRYQRILESVRTSMRTNQRKQLLYGNHATIFVSLSRTSDKFKKKASQNTVNKIQALEQNKGIEYFACFHTDASKPWFANCTLLRANIVMINRARANHYNLAASILLATVCPCNTAQQDLDRILRQCPMYDKERTTLLKDLKKLKILLPLRVTVLFTLECAYLCL